MRYLVLFTIFFVVLISLCAIPELPEWPSSDQVQQAGVVLTVDEESPDVFLNVETSSSQIKAGRTLQVFFELRNKQTYDLRNIELESYDFPCFKSGDFIKDDCGNGGTLRKNQSCMWVWKFESREDIDLQRSCPIRFKISYEANYSYFQDIVVLPESEYFQRELEGTLKDVPIRSSSSNSPLNIYITFSEEQPFLADPDYIYYMYINYHNKGKGLFKDVDVSLIVPPNIQNFYCSDYSKTDGTYDLNKDLTFIRNKATPSTCNFTTIEASIIDIKSLSLTATYKYVLYNSISITVKP